MRAAARDPVGGARLTVAAECLQLLYADLLNWEFQRHDSPTARAGDNIVALPDLKNILALTDRIVALAKGANPWL